jgi:protein-disulfide isomerase
MDKFIKKLKLGSLFSALTTQKILVIVIVVGAFFLGSLWTKVQMLEKGTGTGTGSGAAAANAGAKAVVPTAAPAAVAPKLAKDDHILGSTNARIALVEYSDLECPYCKTFHLTATKIVNDYAGKVMWVYRHYPLSFHANAQKEAEASECVNELGGNDAFWKFIDTIYERTTSNGTGFALEKLGPLAAEVGVDQTKFQTCLDSGKYAQKVKDMETQGSKEGVSGTPGNILLDTKTGKTQEIPGAVPFEQIKPLIDGMLK